jgi:hypothetical protein
MKFQKWVMIVGVFAALGLVSMVPSTGMAQQKKEICDNGTDDDGDKAVDCDDSDCTADPFCKPPAPKGFCHNIGGPDDLGGGANCDPVSGDCTITDATDGRTFTIGADEFFGTVIGTTSPKAILAHLQHGDGPTVELIDPPLHLASQDQNHKGANVECFGTRDFEQPEEPGN